MRGFHPRGVSFDALIQNLRKGKKYYVLAYYADLVTSESTIHPRTVEYLDRTKAIAAYKRLLAEDEANGTMKAYSLKEFEFMGDTRDEHVENSMHVQGVHIDVSLNDPSLLGDFRIEKASARKFDIINTKISKRVMTETSLKRAKSWITSSMNQDDEVSA